ncbi:MAG: ATP-binding cassette domain-containing protein [Negativicutes bacterium]|nr:ATP-binding cassette domain-containing protein [Negativicutes bacterium]
MNENILRVENLKVHFALPGPWWKPPAVVHAVDGVSFEVAAGETIGIVGESGCGKSSLARALVGLTPITSGRAVFAGNIDLSGADKPTWDEVHKRMQFIFQDPIAALNPRMTIAEIVAEPLQTLYPSMGRAEVLERVVDTMKLVGLSPEQINRYPTEFSGGQCQRIGIARALILRPQVLICDEAVSSLDVSIKAQIINLLQDLQQEFKLTVLFISHDLSVVRKISQRIMVMYLGHIMEINSCEAIYSHPLHPYTEALLAAIPQPDPVLERNKPLRLLEGDLPSPINPPAGCVFNSRCPLADDRCRSERPPVVVRTDGAVVSCWRSAGKG